MILNLGTYKEFVARLDQWDINILQTCLYERGTVAGMICNEMKSKGCRLGTDTMRRRMMFFEKIGILQKISVSPALFVIKKEFEDFVRRIIMDWRETVYDRV